MSSQFSDLQDILGSAITVGLRFPNPRAPDLPARQSFSFVIRRASDTDSFNLFSPLPEESQDGTNYRPKHCGIDFKFDGKKALLRVALRFRTAQPGDATIRELFGLEPLIVDMASDAQTVHPTIQAMRTPMKYHHQLNNWFTSMSTI
jgi:hypothetical protein